MHALLRHLGLPPEEHTTFDSLPGVTSCSKSLRTVAQAWSFITDDGSIPPEATFTYKHTCWDRYHGPCETADVAILKRLTKLGKGFHTTVQEGTWFKVSCELGSGENGETFYLFAAYRRCQNPAVSVYVLAQLEGDLLTLRAQDNPQHAQQTSDDNGGRGVQ